MALHSTGSASPTSHLGPGSPFDGGGAFYLADVLDQLGDDIAGRCAWDTEPWATLRQQLVAAGDPPAPPIAGTTFNVRRWHCCSACSQSAQLPVRAFLPPVGVCLLPHVCRDGSSSIVIKGGLPKPTSCLRGGMPSSSSEQTITAMH